MYVTGGEINVNSLYKISPDGTETKMVTLGFELTFVALNGKFLYVSRLDGPVYKVLIPPGL